MPSPAVAEPLPAPLIEVDAADGRYAIRFELETELPYAAVYHLITDYNRLNRLNPHIRESRIVAAPSADALQVYTRIEGCVLVFCSELIRLEHIREPARGTIESEIVPEYSDFRRGHAIWRIEATAMGTRVRYDATFEPKRKLLPWLGPWMVRQVLREQLTDSAARLRGGVALRD
ncbi:MAG: SRPBCC family protein [Thiotrichales bacterium]